MEETADTPMDQLPDAEEVPGEEPGNTSEPEPEVQRGTAAAVYPVPLSTHEEVFANRDVFMDTLQQFHLSFFGTPLGRVPQVAGKELDLHVLYTQVTEKGGLDEVVKEKRWKEISSAFNFPATCTSGSFTLRKYYAKLLHDYEQVYYFRKAGAPVPPPVFAVLATGKGSDVGTPVEVKQPKKKQKKSHPTETPTQALPMPQLPDISALVGSTVSGSVDAAFEFGYFITVNVNGQDYKGVLYQSPEARGEPLINPTYFPSISAALGADGNPITPASIGHKKKKKGDAKPKDPNAPKPNKTAFNYFSAEARDVARTQNPSASEKDISRIVGEMWQKTPQEQRTRFIESSNKDKARYEAEIVAYKARQLEAGATPGAAADTPASASQAEVPVAEAPAAIPLALPISGAPSNEVAPTDGNEIAPDVETPEVPMEEEAAAEVPMEEEAAAEVPVEEEAAAEVPVEEEAAAE